MEDSESKKCPYCNKLIQSNEYKDHITCHEREYEEKVYESNKKKITKCVFVCNDKPLDLDMDFEILSYEDCFEIKKGKKSKGKKNEKK